MTISARAKSAVPAAEIMVRPITRKVVTRPLPPVSPWRKARNRHRPTSNTPLNAA
ncbi:hypothetical protein D3C75_1098750 [compost metagenome]